MEEDFIGVCFSVGLVPLFFSPSRKEYNLWKKKYELIFFILSDLSQENKGVFFLNEMANTTSSLVTWVQMKYEV